LFGKTPLKAQNDYVFQNLGGTWRLWLLYAYARATPMQENAVSNVSGFAMLEHTSTDFVENCQKCLFCLRQSWSN